MENWRGKETEKNMKYAPLRFELKRQVSGYDVIQHNIIIDAMGGVSMETANYRGIKTLLGERKCAITILNNATSFSSSYVT